MRLCAKLSGVLATMLMAGCQAAEQLAAPAHGPAEAASWSREPVWFCLDEAKPNAPPAWRQARGGIEMPAAAVLHGDDILQARVAFAYERVLLPNAELVIEGRGTVEHDLGGDK